MAIVRLGIEHVTKTLGRSLEIPPYQRPYKWEDRLVAQLLTDLLAHPDDRAFRLGTLVFHEPVKGNWQVVDGQQRLITLALLAHCLQCRSPLGILKHPVTQRVSQENIASNFRLIESRLGSLDSDRKAALKKCLEERCEWSVIVLDDLSEAFQFFDSHNTRGKELEPFDLLKAYHLRAMDKADERERNACVTTWEDAVASGDLKKVMDDFLYRIRRWLQGKPGRNFHRADVGLFKGVRLEQDDFPYLRSLRVQEHFTKHYAEDPVRFVDRQTMGFPFQIGQVLIDGQRFFEYVQHYTVLWRSLNGELERAKPDLFKVLDTYPGRNRKGDKLTRNLFDCLVLCILDKFGPDALQKVLPVAFAWAYELRLKRSRVEPASMDAKAREAGNMFGLIQHAVRPDEIAHLPLPQYKPSDVEASTKTDEIKAYLKIGVNP